MLANVRDSFKALVRLTQNGITSAEDVRKLKDDVSGISGTLASVSAITAIHLPSSTTRRATLPFPPTQLIANYGMLELAHIAFAAYSAFQVDLLNREIVHITDLQDFLREELNAAYELMQTGPMNHWWDGARAGQLTLVQDIRMRNARGIEETRTRFVADIGENDHNKATESLAWCVFVESLLLNERLV